MIAPLLRRYRGALQEAPRDLPLLGFCLSLFLLAGAVLAKLLAARVAFGGAGGGALPATLRALERDLALVACLLLAALLARFGPAASERLRPWLFLGLELLALALLLAWFVNVEFFSSWAAPLTSELLSLARHLAAYIFAVGVTNTAGALTAFAVLGPAAVLLAPALAAALGPRLVSAGRWRPVAWLPAALCAAAALGVNLVPGSGDYREGVLRRLNPVDMLVPPAAAELNVQAALSEADQGVLARTLGPETGAAAGALEPLRGRRPNVVFWVLESVSSRYLRSLHPLGEAATPQLDRARGQGALTFTQAYSECPLTVQTTWALLTGMSPPAKPFVFLDAGLPPHSATLSGELKKAGYRTGVFYSSYTHMWGTRRIFDIVPFDAFEDGDVLGGLGRYATNGIGVQDEAPVERFVEWLDSRDPKGPFAALLWNTETHRPYTWAGMPDALARQSEYARYVAGIERADVLFGRLWSALQERRLLDDTLLIVVGDHGEGHGRAPRRWDVSHSGQVFEDDVHVPLLFLHPKLRGETAQLVTHTDLLPTLSDLLGLPPPPGLDGRSLLRPAVPRPLFLRSIVWWPLAIRAGRFKLLLPEVNGQPMLYDLEQDPIEAVDRGAAHPDVRSALTAELLRWHAERFRNDPSFGARFLRMERVWGGPIRSLDWARPSPSPSAEASPR